MTERGGAADEQQDNQAGREWRLHGLCLRAAAGRVKFRLCGRPVRNIRCTVKACCLVCRPALIWVGSTVVEQPRKPSGLVGPASRRAEEDVGLVAQW